MDASCVVVGMQCCYHELALAVGLYLLYYALAYGPAQFVGIRLCGFRSPIGQWNVRVSVPFVRDAVPASLRQFLRHARGVRHKPVSYTHLTLPTKA